MTRVKRAFLALLATVLSGALITTLPASASPQKDREASAHISASKPEVYCYTANVYLTKPRPKTCYLYLAGSDGFGMVLLHARWKSAKSGRADVGFIGDQGIYRVMKNRKFKFKRVRSGEAGVRYYTAIRTAGTNWLMFSNT